MLHPPAQVVLGLEVRMHSVKGAPVDTSVGDFVRPGMATKIPEFTKEEVRFHRGSSGGSRL